MASTPHGPQLRSLYGSWLLRRDEQNRTYGEVTDDPDKGITNIQEAMAAVVHIPKILTSIHSALTVLVEDPKGIEPLKTAMASLWSTWDTIHAMDSGYREHDLKGTLNRTCDSAVARCLEAIGDVLQTLETPDRTDGSTYRIWLDDREVVEELARIQKNYAKIARTVNKQRVRSSTPKSREGSSMVLWGGLALAAVMCILILIVARSSSGGRSTPSEGEQSHPLRNPPAPTKAQPVYDGPSVAPPVAVCGTCNGDGRIDARDKGSSPSTTAPEGPCPYCGGKGRTGVEK